MFVTSIVVIRLNYFLNQILQSYYSRFLCNPIGGMLELLYFNRDCISAYFIHSLLASFKTDSAHLYWIMVVESNSESNILLQPNTVTLTYALTVCWSKYTTSRFLQSSFDVNFALLSQKLILVSDSETGIKLSTELTRVRCTKNHENRPIGSQFMNCLRFT